MPGQYMVDNIYGKPYIWRYGNRRRYRFLVSDRRQGQWVYYRLQDTLPAWVQQLLAVTAEGVERQASYMDGRAALATMPERPGRTCCA